MNCFWKIPLPCFRTIALAHLLARDLPKHFYVIILANFHLFLVIICKLSLIITFMINDILLWKQLVTKYWWQKPPSFLRQFTFAKVSLKFIFESMINLLISFVKFNFFICNLIYVMLPKEFVLSGTIVCNWHLWKDRFRLFFVICKLMSVSHQLWQRDVVDNFWILVTENQRWQWCWWYYYVGDFMMATDLRCWDKTCHQQIWSPIYVTNIDVTNIKLCHHFSSRLHLEYRLGSMKYFCEFLNEFSAGSLGIVEIEINWFKPVLDIAPKNGHSKLIFTAERRISICFRNFRNQFENRFEPVL